VNYPIPNRKSANKEGNGHSRVAKKALTSELPPCKVDATLVFSSESLCGSSSYATSPSKVSIFKALRAPAAGYLSSPCMMTVQREVGHCHWLNKCFYFLLSSPFYYVLRAGYSVQRRQTNTKKSGFMSSLARMA
jgi:hypothetical protein